MSHERIFELQALDVALAELRARAKALQHQVTDLEKQLATARKDLEAAREKHKHLSASAKLLENHVESLNARKKDLQSRQDRSTNVKQLDASRAELVAVDAQIAAKEEELLAAYDAAEQQKTSVDKAQTRVAQLEGQIPPARVQADEGTRTIQEELSRKETARAALKVTIDGDLVARYEGVMRQREVPVLFAIEENACESCGLPSPAVVFNRMRQVREGVFNCPNCGCLLVYTGV